MNTTRRPPCPHNPYTVHTLSIGETHKVRQRGMLSNHALQVRAHRVRPKMGKQKHGMTNNTTKLVKKSKKTPR